MGPTLQDVDLILSLIYRYKSILIESDDEELWLQTKKVVRLLTQKALNSVDDEIELHKEVLKYQRDGPLDGSD